MPVVLRQTSVEALNIQQSIDVSLAADYHHQDWIRWILASVNKHFTLKTTGLPLYLEGDERTKQTEAEFLELRVDGPFIKNPQKGLFIVNIEINVLTQTHMDDKDLYKNSRITGHALRAFTNNICIYRLGNGIFDDQSLFGNMRLNRDLDETVDVNSFGIIKDDVRITQSTVEGHYEMEIFNDGSN